MFPPQFTQIMVLLFWLQKLFEEAGSALDVPSMAGSSRTGLLITMILACSGQVLERPCTSLSQSNDWFKLGLIKMLMHWMRLRWRSRMVMIWYFDNKYPLSINIFLPYISNGQLSSLDDVCLLFSAIGCFWTSQYFPPKSHLIVIFSLFWNFWLPLHSHSVLHDYCSIDTSCAVSNSAEGGDVKSKSCLLFMINDPNFLMSIFVGLSWILQSSSCI